MNGKIFVLGCTTLLLLVPAAVSEAATLRVPGDGTFGGAGGVLEQALSNATPTLNRTDTILFDADTAETADTDFDIDFANAAYTDVTGGLHRQVTIAKGRPLSVTLTGFQAAATATDVFEIFGGAYGIVIQGFFLNMTAAVDFNDVAAIRIGSASTVTVRKCSITGPNRPAIGFFTAVGANNCDFINCTANSIPESEDDTGSAGSGFVFLGNAGSAVNCEANGVAGEGFRIFRNNHTLKNCTADGGLGTNANIQLAAFDVQANNTTLINCRSAGQAAFSAFLVFGQNNICQNCVGTLSGFAGFNLASGGNTFKNCRAGGSTGGVDEGNAVDGFFFGADGNHLENCSAIENTGDGYDCLNSSFFKNCRATDNGGDGYSFVNNNNCLIGCSALRNGAGQGFDVTGDGNLLQTCRASENGAEEFLVGGTGNFLDRCAAPGPGSTFDEATDNANANIAEEIAGDGNAGRSCTSGGTIDEEFRLRGN